MKFYNFFLGGGGEGGGGVGGGGGGGGGRYLWMAHYSVEVTLRKCKHALLSNVLQQGNFILINS